MPLSGRKYSLLEDTGGVELVHATEKVVAAEDCSISSPNLPGIEDVKSALEYLSPSIKGKDHNNLITHDHNVTSGSYLTIVNGIASGTDGYPPSTTFKFIVEAAKSGVGGDMDVRLYDESGVSELAALNFTTTTPTIKEATFTTGTSQFKISVQGKKTNAAGVVFAANIVAEW